MDSLSFRAGDKVVGTVVVDEPAWNEQLSGRFEARVCVEDR